MRFSTILGCAVVALAAPIPLATSTVVPSLNSTNSTTPDIPVDETFGWLIKKSNQTDSADVDKHNEAHHSTSSDKFGWLIKRDSQTNLSSEGEHMPVHVSPARQKFGWLVKDSNQTECADMSQGTDPATGSDKFGWLIKKDNQTNLSSQDKYIPIHTSPARQKFGWLTKDSNQTGCADKSNATDPATVSEKFGWLIKKDADKRIGASNCDSLKTVNSTAPISAKFGWLIKREAEAKQLLRLPRDSAEGSTHNSGQQ